VRAGLSAGAEAVRPGSQLLQFSFLFLRFVRFTSASVRGFGMGRGSSVRGCFHMWGGCGMGRASTVRFRSPSGGVKAMLLRLCRMERGPVRSFVMGRGWGMRLNRGCASLSSCEAV
jgi:hypothetical protein